MSIFDRLTKNAANEREFEDIAMPRGAARPVEQTQGGVAVYKPKSYSEVVEIIERLRKNASAIVHLDEIKESTAQRVSDILSGAIIALGGSMYEIQPKIFIYTPSGVDVMLDQ
jgi:FtsZ-interacting cell division protein YlmF